MKSLYLLVIFFGFSQCASTQFDKTPPFEIESATYTQWVGGIEGVSGKSIQIKLSKKTTIAFDSLFFQNKIMKIVVENSEGTSFLIGNYSTSTKQKNELILHSNPAMESKNEIPKKKKCPFSLKKNEAIIRYKIQGVSNYYKIENLQKTSSKFFQ